jgi:hypothetical protein
VAVNVPTQFDDDDRKHLDLIQGVISRLASNQFLIKGWTLTVAAAVFGFAATQRQWPVALLGVVVAIAFWGLDAYFLRQERLFRHLWVEAIKRPRPTSLAPYSLDVGGFRNQVPYLKRVHDENGRPRQGTALAGSVAVLHGTVVVVGVVVLVATAVSHAHHSGSTPIPRPRSHSSMPGHHRPP